mmetsp:Transcript_41976/g.103534  ORF Transcript_41976/g.103534 Transcript_41976/m.103534 type:complete len:116 (-) Transcript_41976:277-624(-)
MLELYCCSSRECTLSACSRRSHLIPDLNVELALITPREVEAHVALLSNLVSIHILLLSLRQPPPQLVTNVLNTDIGFDNNQGLFCVSGALLKVEVEPRAVAPGRWRPDSTVSVQL